MSRRDICDKAWRIKLYFVSFGLFPFVFFFFFPGGELFFCYKNMFYTLHNLCNEKLKKQHCGWHNMHMMIILC